MIPTIEQMLARTRAVGECREWTGDRDRSGYGRLDVNKKRQRASRVAWSLANGAQIPDGMLVCHKCDNPPCINPAHLFIGTQSDNIKDAAAKRRLQQFNRPPATHCRMGHEFSPENTIPRNEGKRKRRCRICAIAQRTRRTLRAHMATNEGGSQ